MNVLVTGVGGGGHGEQIAKALTLATTDYRIFGTDMSTLSKGLYTFDNARVIPPASDLHYIDALLSYCAEQKIDALFHGSEPELKAMSIFRNQIAAAGIFLPINPSKVIELCMDKLATMDWLRKHGFCHPRYRRVRANTSLEDVDWLPVVLKPSVGGGGSSQVFIAQTRDELLTFATYLLNVYEEFIVQEYVGTVDSEFTVGVLLDMEGQLINSIAVKRTILSGLSNKERVVNRTGRTDLGPLLAVSSGVSQGQIGRFEHITAPCEAIARALGATGAINIQCRYYRDSVYVFEINPRFSGTTSLRAMVGYNEPDVLIRRHLLNDKIEPHFPYSSGFIFRGLDEVFVEQLIEY